MLEEFLSDPRSGVVLVDMQTSFVRWLRQGAAERIIPAQIKVLDAAKRHGTSVAILEFDGYGVTIPQLNVFREDVELDQKTFIKYSDSGFRSTYLDEWLKSKRIHSLLLMGINACFCVKKTAQDALECEYRVVTSPKLISGQDHHPLDDDIGWYGANGSLLDI